VIFLAVLALGVGIPFVRARAAYSYSLGVDVQQVSDFYDALAPFGYWVEVPRFGWCWYPAYVEPGWRPYTNGHWLWSDDGWYWASEEPWAWAAYHYGRWAWDPYYGWLWVPGIEWAPAWVGWREGDDYVGWAPLPPECDFGPSSDVIYVQQVVIAPQYFVFIERRHFCDLVRPNVVIVNNTTIVNKTVNITKINRVNHVVVNQGPPVDGIQKSNPGKVVRAKIERRIPASIQQVRQHQRENRPEIRPTPEIIRGSRDQAAQNALVQPMSVRAPDATVTPPVQRDRAEPSARRSVKEQKREEHQVLVRQTPPPPVVPAALVQDAPTINSEPPAPQSERGHGTKIGHQRRGAELQGD
jgi:hypothetical protein